MKYWLLKVRPRAVLVVRPREHSFGHQVYELLMGLHMAKARGAALALREPDHCANRAVFAIECCEVTTLTGVARLVALTQAMLLDRVQAIRVRWSNSRARWQRSVLDILTATEARVPAARGWRKRYKSRLPARHAVQPQDYFGLDFRVCYARQPLHLQLRREVRTIAASAARALGLAEGAPLVAVHARESGFKAAAGGESPSDAIRNARIDTYVPALEALIRRGFTVVRIGDPAMTPLHVPGIIDLATSPTRTDALELWVLMHSTLFIAGDSGPFAASLLSPAPCLAVNVTNVLGGYPVRRRDRYILKRVFDTQRGRELTLDEMLDPEYFVGRKDLERYRVIDNTTTEIAEAVDEMLQILAGDERRSDEQRAFHRHADAAYNSPLVASRRTRKGEPARQLLGDGLIGRAYAQAMWRDRAVGEAS